MQNVTILKESWVLLTNLYSATPYWGIPVKKTQHGNMKTYTSNLLLVTHLREQKGLGNDDLNATI